MINRVTIATAKKAGIAVTFKHILAEFLVAIKSADRVRIYNHCHAFSDQSHRQIKLNLLMPASPLVGFAS
ncbi:hypothetical protein D3C73_1630570 [compost metagenome]